MGSKGLMNKLRHKSERDRSYVVQSHCVPIPLCPSPIVSRADP